jgi:toxin ParE1/3/4
VPRLRVRYRPAAYDDLEDIFRFVLKISGNRITAERLTTRIKARCDKVGILPFAGRLRDDLAPGLRTVPFERSAVIVYEVKGDWVSIVNVFYGGRDYEAFYLGERIPGDDTEG